MLRKNRSRGPKKSRKKTDFSREIAVFGESVRALRQELGLTIEQLAERADLSNNHVSEIERAKTNPRLDTFRQMVAKNPENTLARFGLANEALKAGLYDEARASLEAYLASYDDEGNGYGRLAEALEKLGRSDEARDALRRGIAASRRFGHPGMASEFEARLEVLE